MSSTPNSRFEEKERFYAEYAQRLRSILSVLEIEEHQAASDFGVSLRTFRRWLTGAVHRDHRRGFINFCKKHHVSVDWLLVGKGPQLRPDDFLNRRDLSRQQLADFIRETPNGMMAVVVNDGWLVYASSRHIATLEQTNRVQRLPRLVA